MKRSNWQIDVEEAFKKKLKAKDEELNVLKREIRVKNNEMTLKCGEFNTMKHKVRRQNLLIQKLKDKLECPVCLDVPRNAPVPVCLNGHFVCQKCKRDSCPSCRIFCIVFYCHTRPSGHLYPIRIETYPIGYAEEWHYFRQEPASHPAYNLSLKFKYLCNLLPELYQIC